MSKLKVVKNNPKEANTKKQLDDNILEIILGSILIIINKFNSDVIYEKILVILGFIILLVGLVRSIIKYKKQENKQLVITTFIICCLTIIIFLAILYKILF